MACSDWENGKKWQEIKMARNWQEMARNGKKWQERGNWHLPEPPTVLGFVAWARSALLGGASTCSIRSNNPISVALQ